MKQFNWGNYPVVKQPQLISPSWRHENPFLLNEGKSVLPHGNGRSYGDSALNADGVLIDTRLLNHFIHFDSNTGVIRCESGVLLADILSLVIPTGWLLPVLPGTQYVTVGGAIANDVHGKNHHQTGTFGCHVTQFELLRSDGNRLICSPHENIDLFQATIGGLGLTGLIVWAEIQLKPFPSPFLEVTTTPFKGMAEFLQLSSEAEHQAEYTVAWLDCQAKGERWATGLFMSANPSTNPGRITQRNKKTVPFYLPSFTLNTLSITAFNRLYYYLSTRQSVQTKYFEPYFFPLDNILHWNRIYGRRGFLQYQFVLPFEAEDALAHILKKITQSGLGSFLSVLKTFGNIPSPGLLSFPIPGVTLALDFPNKKSVFTLLNELDQTVMTAGGRVYIAKDARMSAAVFQHYYPNYSQFAKWIDPNISSSFWRRAII
ncbi:MAG: FAD-binding oxidoreductase [Legionellaceae bacterium]|nr:FAD-binding oxidoreductase [Legionellaceae bacterium]